MSGILLDTGGYDEMSIFLMFASKSVGVVCAVVGSWQWWCQEALDAIVNAFGDVMWTSALLKPARSTS